jgi:hypothetical protein
MCPIVPMFTCGFVRSYLAFAMRSYLPYAPRFVGEKYLEPMSGIEPETSPLPRACSAN